MKTTNLKPMSKAVNMAYKYIPDTQNRVNINKINLPPEVTQTLLRMVKKHNGIIYGSSVGAFNYPNHRKSNDLDIYLDEREVKLFIFDLIKIYGGRIKTKFNEKFRTTKILYQLPNKRWVELGDVAIKHTYPKRNGKYTVTDKPISAKINREPVKTYYGKYQSESPIVQHQRKINAVQSNINTNKPRLKKDLYDMGVEGRESVYLLVKKYSRNKTPELKIAITNLLKEIVTFSTGSAKVIRMRTDFENACIRNNLTNVRFFSARHKKFLEEIKKKLANNTFDLDKDLFLVENAVKPIPVNHRNTIKTAMKKVVLGKRIKNRKTIAENKRKARKGIKSFIPKIKVW